MYENLREVSQPHRKLSEVKQKVQFPHKMFSTDRQNVDGSGRKVQWTNGLLTEVSLTDLKLTNVEGNTATAWKFDGCSRGRIES